MAKLLSNFCLLTLAVSFLIINQVKSGPVSSWDSSSEEEDDDMDEEEADYDEDDLRLVVSYKINNYKKPQYEQKRPEKMRVSDYQRSSKMLKSLSAEKSKADDDSFFIPMAKKISATSFATLSRSTTLTSYNRNVVVTTKAPLTVNANVGGYQVDSSIFTNTLSPLELEEVMSEAEKPSEGVYFGLPSYLADFGGIRRPEVPGNSPPKNKIMARDVISNFLISQDVHSKEIKTNSGGNQPLVGKLSQASEISGLEKPGFLSMREYLTKQKS